MKIESLKGIHMGRGEHDPLLTLVKLNFRHMVLSINPLLETIIIYSQGHFEIMNWINH